VPKNIWKIAVLILPIMIMTLSIGTHSHHSHNRLRGKQWRIPITTFEPLRLLHGNHLSFNYDWRWNENIKNECSSKRCVLCLQKEPPSGPYYNPMVHITSLPIAEKQCDSFINGHTHPKHQFEIETKEGPSLRRYTWQEAINLKLNSRDWNNHGHQFHVGLRVNDSGQAFVEHIYIDNIPLEEWIEKHNKAK
jgi:hypothetical protein